MQRLTGQLGSDRALAPPWLDPSRRFVDVQFSLSRPPKTQIGVTDCLSGVNRVPLIRPFKMGAVKQQLPYQAGGTSSSPVLRACRADPLLPRLHWVPPLNRKKGPVQFRHTQLAIGTKKPCLMFSVSEVGGFDDWAHPLPHFHGTHAHKALIQLRRLQLCLCACSSLFER